MRLRVRADRLEVGGGVEVVEVAAHPLQASLRRVHVCVLEPGQERSAARVDHRRGRPDHPSDVGVVAHAAERLQRAQLRLGGQVRAQPLVEVVREYVADVDMRVRKLADRLVGDPVLDVEVNAA